jgi:hypothetical protein
VDFISTRDTIIIAKPNIKDLNIRPTTISRLYIICLTTDAIVLIFHPLLNVQQKQRSGFVDPERHFIVIHFCNSA